MHSALWETEMKNAPSCSSWASLRVIATVARLLCRELTLQNEYLRAENEVLKSKIKGRIRFTDEERRSLVEPAVAMGRRLMDQVVRIVKPETILAWQRRLEREKWDYSSRTRREPGRPRTSTDVESLVCRLARENAWGYLRIHGELLKLDIRLSKGGIADILRRNNLPPSPERKGPTWREFLARHAEVMLCADLFTKEVWTFCGLKTAYVLVVMHLATRRVILAQATFCPRGSWMAQMGRNALMACEEQRIRPRFILHDRDGLLVHHFDETLTSAGVEIAKTPFRAPNANAHAERWVLSVKQECLDPLVLFSLENLQHTLDVYRTYYNDLRPHQGIGQQVPAAMADAPSATPPRNADPRQRSSPVVCTPLLGGLLKSYSRRAA
jgi:putative transposase